MIKKSPDWCASSLHLLFNKITTIVNYININGKITAESAAGISIDNGAFRYGYGLFETILVSQGEIGLRQYHLHRLVSGMQLLQLDLPKLISNGLFEEQVLPLVKKNGLGKLCRVRLQVFAGGGGLYGSKVNEAGFVIECFPLDDSVLQLNENGLVVGIAVGLHKSTDALANLKSCNALIYSMAARQAKDNKWNDALVSNTKGNITESTIANVFWIKNGTVFTPPLSEGCIAGVMRRHIAERIQVTEKELHIDELLTAEEVFLTNAIRKIKWIGNIGSTSYGNKQIREISNLI
jgi:branched-chain amino acid aminotransferase